MAEHIAFLRGINVGGHKIVKKEALERIFTSFNFKRVRTLLASGNVLFEAPPRDEAALAEKIEAGLAKSLGFEVSVMLRSRDHLEKLAKADPFKKHKVGGDVKRYVCFLSDVPEAPPPFPKPPAGERWEILSLKGRELFVAAAKGFPTRFVEKDLGVTVTTRNWNTVLKALQQTGPA